MPELPEVETVVSDLNKKIKGDMIASFWSEWGKAIKGKSIETFKKEIKNRKILGARRIGKNIFIDLSGGKTLYIHLKMTGHLLVKKKEERSKNKEKSDYFSDRVNQYIRHKFFLKSGRTLEFSDLRKFGKIVLDSTEKINNLKEIKALGVDALDPKFTFQKFQEILRKKSSAKIGIILMDQDLIAGIGNIYRSEILYDAGILPERIIKSISEKDLRKIYDATKKILKKAIKMRGTSDSDYRDTSGAPGNFQKILAVYNREKRGCKRCDTIIQRKVLGQRSVFICSKCQK
ncbi:MAG TPA: bifunctional DNA-formamidopyrimidine glycosylase/DNA-(apurinic or apyrimidinic site) lyase [Candidatus Moranbacteria bacterium]|nr:bifunctional DNA-formamidopyrimidine glycosylase/DNA-(apurinic or apyrimidinic site) lyase [Candidatus Moranbacteria bacterium]